LDFWQDRFVVRTAILKVNPANRAAQMAFAKACSARIGGVSAIPAVVKSLPPGYQPNSEKYVRKNVAGHSFLSNAITARYPKLGQGAELFIATYANPKSAKAALDGYRNYEKSGTGLAPLKGIGTGGFIVRDRFAKTVAVTQKGKYVIGAHHVKSPADAQKLLQQAYAKVK
jgi:hypothetical protein